MKVLFTHSYFLHLDPKQYKAGKPYPPLATLYAMSYLRQNGFEVQLADLQFSEPHEIERYLKSFKPDVFVIYDDAFNYLVKMCLTNMRDAVVKMMQTAKNLGVKVIVSSSDATDNQTLYLSQGADILIIGEAEESLLEVCVALNAQGTFSHIEGLVYMEEGKYKATSPRKVRKQLDELPSPAWDAIDLSVYKKMWLQNAGYFSLNLVTTRGCPYKCNWCAKPVYGNRYNSHSPARVASEIQLLKEKYDVEHIWFADDIFGLKPGFTEALALELEGRQLKVPFKIQSRADLLVKESVLIALQQAGCAEIWMGAESGSQKVLDAMDKGITLQEIALARQLCQKFHIRLAFFLQFGYPDENAQDIAATIDMVDRLQPDDIGISVSYPLPGTVFYERVKSQFQDKKNWQDSDDLAMMFRGNFAPAFYRVLQKYVHYRFRTREAIRKCLRFSLDRQLILLPYYFLQQLVFRLRMKRLMM